jgi:hypothetical protein
VPTRLGCEEIQQLSPRDPLAEYRSTPPIHPEHENILGDIQTDYDNFRHGRLPQVVLNTSTLAHRCRRGASTPSSIGPPISAFGRNQDIKRAGGAGETRVPQRRSPPLWAITSGSSKSEALEAWTVRKFEWSASWVEAMLYTAEKQPAAFFATCARLLPNDVRVTVEQSLPGIGQHSDRCSSICREPCLT